MWRNDVKYKYKLKFPQNNSAWKRVYYVITRLDFISCSLLRVHTHSSTTCQRPQRKPRMASPRLRTLRRQSRMNMLKPSETSRCRGSLSKWDLTHANLKNKGWYFSEDIFKCWCIFWNEKWCILIDILLRFVYESCIDNKSSLVLVMAWCSQAASHFLNLWWPIFCGSSSTFLTFPDWRILRVKPCTMSWRLTTEHTSLYT